MPDPVLLPTRDQESGRARLPECLVRPQIRLSGLIDDTKFIDFQRQLDAAVQSDGPIGLELSTTGGDANLAIRITTDLRLLTEHEGREFWFIGKTMVYSAGVTIMAGFPRERRFLTRDCILLIHERRLQKTVELDGPLEGLLQRVDEIENELKVGVDIERSGFASLCEGSDVSLEECIEKARTSWYVKADEALERRLVEGVI